ncbi:MAG: DUF4339 domain-containing protein [Oligoflexia bacterium]|nr:DUF4339 domain-containing protein [Oligoflexia bacterium]
MKIGFGISTKIIFMVTIIVVTAIGTVMTVSTDLFKEESLTRVQESNKDLAESLATQSFEVLKKAAEQATFVVQALSQSKEVAQNIFRTYDDLIGVGIFKMTQNNSYEELAFFNKDEILAEFDITLQNYKSMPMPYLVDAVLKNKNQDIFIKNISSIFKKPVLSVFFFTQENAQTKEKWLVRADIRQDTLIKLFSKKPKTDAYLLDSDGNLLVHSDAKLVLNRYNFSSYPIVQKIREGKLNNHQMEFQNDQGVSFLGAFKKTNFANTAVVTQVEKDYALSALERVQYRTLLVTAIIVGLAFLLNYMFSHSMTSPLGMLYRATEKIAQGQFDVKLNVKSSDEIGALTVAFSKMAQGLQERDKLKTTFNKFHSKEIAQKILHGEMKLGGEKKTATVFFSDIRGFTSLSEKMSPDEVVHMLNEYMTEMVKIIQKHKGVVDKYVGDAIMALWGVPESTSQDAPNCVRAALEMREAMIKFNQKRKAKALPELQIGIGIHTGEVLAGNIGSEERLEYTVIGDTVNQASRIESANKEFDSDILISDTTYALIKAHNFAIGPALEIKVKGKAEKIIVHQVVGTTDSSGNVNSALSHSAQEKIKTQPEELKQKAQSNQTQAMPNMPPDTSSGMYQTGPRQMPITHSGHMPNHEPADLWFLVKDVNAPNHIEGPYSVSQLKVVAAQPGIILSNVYVFKDGDPQMIPIIEMPGFSRRAPVRPLSMPMGISLPPAHVMDTAGPSEWYIYVSDTQTMGPYNMGQLEQMLLNQQITRTTYVWKQGMQNWMYLYQVPGFDRRAA